MRISRWRRRALVALVVVAALAFAVRAALSWAIARAIESEVGSALGLPLRVANVDLWLVRGAAAVDGIVVGRATPDAGDSEAAPDPATALLTLSRLHVDLEWFDLLERRVHLRELALDGPRLRIERYADGRIDPLGAAEPSTPTESEAEPAEPSPPWSIAVDRFDLRGLELGLADLGTQRTPVELEVARLSLVDVSVDGAELGIGGVEIESPVLGVDREFLFGAGGGAPDEEPTADVGTEESAALAYRIARIGVANAGLTLRSDTGPIDVSVRLDAEQVNPTEPFPIVLELGIADGTIELMGRVGLRPLAYEGRLTWQRLGLPPLGAALLPELAGWVRSCRADGELRIDLVTEGGGDARAGLRVSGSAKVADLEVADPSDRQLRVAWKELEVTVREALLPLAAEGQAPAPVRVAIERVRLAEPDLLYTLPATALDELVGGGEEESAEAGGAGAEPPPGSGAPAPEIELGALDLEAGRVRFRDETVSPAVETAVRDLAVAVQGARLPARQARSVRGRGIVGDAGAFRFDGSLGADSGELVFELERLSLPPFDPYAAGAGYRLESGEASLESKARMRGSRSEARNQLVLHRLDLASEDPGAFEKQFGMPLDLALALLRDPGGDISLSIPLVVDESGARAGLVTIVRGALRSALVGALSSPLKLVGAVLPEGGRSGATLEPIVFRAGQVELAPDTDERLGALAGLLAERPALALRLRGRAGPVDRAAVAEQILAERAAAGESWPQVDGVGATERSRIADALDARARGESGGLSGEDTVRLARLAAAVSVPAERMQSLAQRRAEAVRDAIAAARRIDPRRLEVAGDAAEGDPAVVLELAAAQGDA